MAVKCVNDFIGPRHSFYTNAGRWFMLQ